MSEIEQKIPATLTWNKHQPNLNLPKNRKVLLSFRCGLGIKNTEKNKFICRVCLSSPVMNAGRYIVQIIFFYTDHDVDHVSRFEVIHCVIRAHPHATFIDRGEMHPVISEMLMVKAFLVFVLSKTSVFDLWMWLSSPI